MTHIRSISDLHRVPDTPCRNCGTELGASRSVNDTAQPYPGGAVVCLDCGHLMIYTLDLKLREPTPAEQVELAGDPNLLAAQELSGQWRRFKKRLPSGE